MTLGLKLATVAFSIYAATGAAAFAQTQTQTQAQAQASAKPDKTERVEKRVMVMRHGGPGTHGRDHTQHMRAILQLRPNQEAALTTYLEAIRPDFDRIRSMAHGVADGMKPGTTAERLAKMERRLADQQAEGRAQIEATRRFYAELDPAQQHAFDELPLRIGAHGLMELAPMVHRMRMPFPPVPPIPPAPL